MGELIPIDVLRNEEFVPEDGDLVSLFVKKQIEIWGWESVQKMFDEGFEPVVVNGKVLWAK
jgi:hypothetical protein